MTIECRSLRPRPTASARPGEVGDAGYLGRLERASVVATLGNLLTFPDIRGRVTAGELRLLGAYFDIGNGDLTIHDPQTGKFELA